MIQKILDTIFSDSIRINDIPLGFYLLTSSMIGAILAVVLVKLLLLN